MDRASERDVAKERPQACALDITGQKGSSVDQKCDACLTFSTCRRVEHTCGPERARAPVRIGDARLNIEQKS